MLLVCTDIMKQESLFFDTGSKYAVCFHENRMEKVFWRFCGFIIMFESCHHALYSSLTNLHMWVEICYASSARQYDVTTRFL